MTTHKKLPGVTITACMKTTNSVTAAEMSFNWQDVDCPACLERISPDAREEIGHAIQDEITNLLHRASRLGADPLSLLGSAEMRYREELPLV